MVCPQGPVGFYVLRIGIITPPGVSKKQENPVVNFSKGIKGRRWLLERFRAVGAAANNGSQRHK